MTPLPGGDEIDILRKLHRVGCVVLDEGLIAYLLSRTFMRVVIKSRPVR